MGNMPVGRQGGVRPALSVPTRRVIILASTGVTGRIYFYGSYVMAKGYNVAVVGATGMVGEVFLDILAKRPFPLRSLKLIASPRSAGKKITFGEQEIEVEALSEKS